MSVSDEIMSNYQHVVSELTLVPGPSGVFDVVAEPETDSRGDATLIYSKKQTGRHANPGEVLTAVEALLPEGTVRYGT